jgi:hypothetical protein
MRTFVRCQILSGVKFQGVPARRQVLALVKFCVELQTSWQLSNFIAATNELQKLRFYHVAAALKI